MKNTSIILELIPTSSNPIRGEVVQLSAIKIEDYKLIDRFDYRLNPDKIALKDLVQLTSYDKSDFVYKQTSAEIMKDFNLWANNAELLILQDAFTQNYLTHYNITNPQSWVLQKLNLSHHDLVFEEILQKYNLAPSNYLVDILFEALIWESNNQ